jgi:uncharacterized protein (DUF1810 family)
MFVFPLIRAKKKACFNEKYALRCITHSSALCQFNPHEPPLQPQPPALSQAP